LQPQLILFLVQGSQQPFSLVVVGPIIGVIGGLAGVLLGGWLANRQRGQEEAERAKAIRRMLQTEIDHNRNEIRDWCENEESKLRDFPVQSNQIWSTNLPSIPAAVKHEKITELHDFYYERHVLRNYVNELKHSLEEAKKAARNEGRDPAGIFMPTDGLRKRAGVFLENYGNLRDLDEDD
jgi:hypothetical protein